MQWILLTSGILTQVCAATCMKLSSSFTNILPTILAFLFSGISYVIFILALKYFDLNFAWAVWGGLGILLIAIVGIFYFHEPVNVVKIISILLIVIGVTGLNLSDMMIK